MKNLFRFIFCFFSVSLNAQIYNADFSNDGDGFLDHSSASPPAAAPASVNGGVAPNDWTLSYTTIPSTDITANSFKVVGGQLVSNDWGGQGIFESANIDVSGISSVDITAISQNVSANDDNFDYFYILDGGSRVTTSIGVTNDGDPVNYNITNLDVSGASTLVVGFEFSENGVGAGYATTSFTVTDVSSPTVGFDNTTSTEMETNAPFVTTIPVTMSNYGGSQVDLSVTVTGGTAEVTDYTLNTNALSFTADGTQNISIEINPDTDADDETVILTIAETTATGVLVASATHTLTITDDEIPTVGDLVINEINYNPAGVDEDYEFIELYNASGTNLNIGGVTFSNGINFTFPAGTTMDTDEYIVIASNATTYSGNGYDVYEYVGGLINSGEQITIEDDNGNIIDDVTYDVLSPWPTAANGTGVTLSLNTVAQNATDNDNAVNWGVSCAIDGTPGAANVNCSYESEIVAVAASEAVSISSLENTAGPLTSTDGVQVWQFTINEGGSDLTDDDALPSRINSLVVTNEVAASDVHSFLDVIKSAAIFDGTTHLGTATITEGALTFSGSPLISIADGTSKTISLRISLNEHIVQFPIDKNDIVFQITDDNVQTPNDGTSSAFLFTTVQSTDTKNQIEVTASSIRFTTQPQNTFKNNGMSDVLVNGVDANNNIDIDFATTVSVTSTGTLVGSPVIVNPSTGTATFSSLTHTTVGTNLTLTAAATGFSNIISSPFDITEALESPGDLIISEYMADPNSANDSESEYFEVYNTTNSAINVDGWVIKDDGSDSHTISSTNGTTIIPAYSFLVFGRSTDGNDNNPDVTLDYIYSGITLANSADEIILEVNSTEICRVNYTNGNSFGAGVAHELLNLTNHPTGVTQGPTGGSDYQAATQLLTSGDKGSPGAIGQALPVELLHFTAKTQNQTAILSWATASEDNNAYFDVQRSTDGINFETIGRVEGAGTTYDVQEYTFIDESPVDGVNYYRLKQVDFNGQSENHKVVMVNINGLESDIAIIPTQVRNQFEVVITESINEPVEMNIISVNGQVVKSTIINMNSNRQTIEVSELNAGVYFVRLNVNNTIVTKRFIKL